MTDKKPVPRRSVSKPRLLKATLATMEEFKLTEVDNIGQLTAAIEKGIVADSMK